jgi:hypothetical protein
MSIYTEIRPLLRRRPWLFFALALGWSWLLWISVILVGASQLAFPGFLLYALGGLGPPAAAILLLYRKHPPQDRRDYWRRVADFRLIGLAWYGVIALLPLAWNVLGIPDRRALRRPRTVIREGRRVSYRPPLPRAPSFLPTPSPSCPSPWSSCSSVRCPRSSVGAATLSMVPRRVTAR